jgi:hypothetical protein
MKSLLFSTACALTLCGAAACAPQTHIARTALDCPASEGALTRTNISADSKTCTYTSSRGDDITIRLVPVSSTPQASLQPIETELRALSNDVAPDAAADASAAPTPPTPPSPPAAASGETAAAAERAAAEAKADAGGADADAEREDKDSRPKHSDHTHVDLPGIHIDADEGSDSAHVSVAGINIDAGDDGAVVRSSKDVRMRGNPFVRERAGYRATFILANDHLAGGYHAVGYQAGGPRTGPLTVAVVKSRTGDNHQIFRDVQRIVRRNSGI